MRQRLGTRMPKVWRCIAIGISGLTEAAAGRWWAALCRSRWSGPVAWRQRVVALNALPAVGPDAVTQFVYEHAQPWQLVELLEQLRHERPLARKVANGLMEMLLARVDRHGAWK